MLLPSNSSSNFGLRCFRIMDKIDLICIGFTTTLLRCCNTPRSTPVESCHTRVRQIDSWSIALHVVFLVGIESTCVSRLHSACLRQSKDVPALQHSVERPVLQSACLRHSDRGLCPSATLMMGRPTALHRSQYTHRAMLLTPLEFLSDRLISPSFLHSLPIS